MPPSHSRAIVLPTTLTIPSTRPPCRLTGLADGNVQHLGLDDGIAIAELRRRLRVGGDPRERFDHVRAGDAGVVGRAAAEDLHAPDGEQIARRQVEAAQVRRAELRIEASLERT